MNEPLVSIVLPTYNWKEEWLSKSIESVLSQSYTNFELIIINDASIVDIDDMILKYSSKDNRIKYFKNDINLKFTKTINRWIWLSNWKYIARIDDDDIWCDNDKLKKQVEFMESNPEYWLCGTCVILINELWKETWRINTIENDEDIRSKILRYNQFAHASVIIRKDVLDKVWGYKPEFNTAEDYELWLRIWRISKLHNIQDFSMKYRINTQWISRKNDKRQKMLWLKALWINKSYYPNFLKFFTLRLWYILLPSFISRIVLKLIKK